MKTLKALLAAGVLMALAIGCSTIRERENLLSAAGFEMLPADTTAKKALLYTLPIDTITAVQREGIVYYTFPDRTKKVLYVGQEHQYQLYCHLGLQNQMTQEQLNPAPFDNDGAWGFWELGGSGRSWALR
jgi:hypothetical protein